MFIVDIIAAIWWHDEEAKIKDTVSTLTHIQTYFLNSIKYRINIINWSEIDNYYMI